MSIDLSSLPMELPGSPSWEHNLNGKVGQRKWLCAWADVADPDSRASWVPVPRVTPFVTGSSILCSNVAVKPVQSANAGDYLLAEVVADYSTADFFGGFVDKQWSGCVKVIRVGEGRTYDDDDTPCDVGLTKQIYMKRLTVRFTRDYVSTYEPAIDAMVGKVNNSTFEGMGAGRVMMEPYRIHQYVNTGSGITMQDVELEFVCTPSYMTHNTFYNAKTGVWTATTPVMYESVSFAGAY